MRSSSPLILFLLLALPAQAQDVTLGDRIKANCSFVNTGEISRDVTVTVQCREVISDLAPLLEDLEQARDEADALGRELHITEGMLISALIIVGEKKVPPEKRAERVVEIIVQQRETIARLRSETGTQNEALDGLRLAAADAIENGELDRADDILAELEAKEEDLELEQQMLAAASTRAERAQVAKIQLRYLDAAKHFGAAAQKVPRTSEEHYLDYLEREAAAFYQQGDEFGDNGALEEAIARRQRLLALYDRARVPLDWAATQNNLGNALQILGERESGTARLEEAVAAYRDALEEWTRERVPLQWATTQNNLGGALQTLGERESGTARLEEARTAIQNAYDEFVTRSKYTQYKPYFLQRLDAIKAAILALENP